MQQTPGAKMIFLIRRKPDSAREELVAHWFSNHMPGVIASQARSKDRGRPYASRYIATLLDANDEGLHPWDGYAALWYPEPFGKPASPHGTTPGDMFQVKAEPYTSWATVEYVVLDGDLDTTANTLNEPYPMTRTGFVKFCALVAAQDGVDFEAMYRHWLEEHTPRVAERMQQTGGFRYCVSLGLNPQDDPYCVLVETYFPSRSAFDAYQAIRSLDGLEAYIDPERTVVQFSSVEMVGIP